MFARARCRSSMARLTTSTAFWAFAAVSMALAVRSAIESCVPFEPEPSVSESTAVNSIANLSLAVLPAPTWKSTLCCSCCPLSAAMVTVLFVVSTFAAVKAVSLPKSWLPPVPAPTSVTVAEKLVLTVKDRPSSSKFRVAFSPALIAVVPPDA